MQVDNAIIELKAEEPPILDGSAKHLGNLILQSETVERDAKRKIFELKDPVTGNKGQSFSSCIALRWSKNNSNVGRRSWILYLALIN
jgi:UDP-3-O-acyl-N-acetylglucosamine deacetylase